jgi:hypothetical protein
MVAASTAAASNGMRLRLARHVPRADVVELVRAVVRFMKTLLDLVAHICRVLCGWAFPDPCASAKISGEKAIT